MAGFIRGNIILRNSLILFKEFRNSSFLYKNAPSSGAVSCFLCKNFHSSNTFFKRKKTEEEKEADNQGRRIIKYSPKTKIHSEIINLWRNMTVSDIAKALNKDTDHVFEAMMFIDNSVHYTEDSSVIYDLQVLKQIVKLSGHNFRIVAKPTDEVEDEVSKDAVKHPSSPLERLKPRPPVVTVMGHVDHGKTTLLDSLRNAHVVDQEFGGITQHIGAFAVELCSGEIVTFLDTPGHAAFSAMRARGANVTDMVVLVVAADDGVMEQTIESIRMARESNVPIIVAINKIDKPEADIERTKKMLATHDIVVEDFGGDIQAVPISALKGTNLDNLVEAIVLQAQLMDLQADPTGPVEGVVVEAQTDPRRGKLATVIVQRGTLRRGTIVVAGQGWAKARIMFNESGVTIQEAPPSTPVQLLGWREMPSAGDEMIEVESEKRARQVMDWRQDQKMKIKQMEDFEVIKQKSEEHQQVYKKALEKKRLMGRFRLKPDGPRQKLYQEFDEAQLNIVVKGDVDGSVEAILDVLETYDEDKKCKLDIVHYGIGDITETDVEMADIFGAVIYGFNVTCPPKIAKMIKEKCVQYKPHNIIYKMVDDLKEEISKRIPVTKDEEIIGEANVLQNFPINDGNKKSFVAGCRCIRGVLRKDSLYRIVRGNETIYEGKLNSMRHLKSEVNSIKKDLECGLMFVDKEEEFKPGDTIICYEMVDVKHDTEWNPPGF